MKKGTVRPMDRFDANLLAERFGFTEGRRVATGQLAAARSSATYFR